MYTRAINFAKILRIRDEYVKELRNLESYGWVSGVWSMLSGDYILESWMANEDDSDLISDAANLNTQVGLISALILTVVIPLYTGQSPINGTPEEPPSDPYAECWLFFMALATITEAVCLLVAIRNLIVLNLVEQNNASEFMQESSGVMLAPVRLNFIAVLSTFLALNFFSVYSYGLDNWFAFFFIIIVPCLFVMLKSIGSGIQGFHKVQPWHREKFWQNINPDQNYWRTDEKSWMTCLLHPFISNNETKTSVHPSHEQGGDPIQPQQQHFIKHP